MPRSATRDVFRVEAPVPLFDSPGWTDSAPFGEAYEVAPGGARFIIPASAQGEVERGPSVILINNFFEEQKRLVPN
jgi:hypothetical protein